MWYIFFKYYINLLLINYEFYDEATGDSEIEDTRYADMRPS